MPSQLRYGVRTNGTLRYDVAQHVYDSSHILLEESDNSYLFVFQSTYSPLLAEGVLGITLYLYDTSSTT
jgi:hypothetical protein